jgi:hypothetical protein
VLNGKLFACYNSSPYNYDYCGYVYIYDNSGNRLNYLSYNKIVGLFTDGTYVYASCLPYSSGDDTYIYKIDPDNYSSESIKFKEFSLVGNLPSAWVTNSATYIKSSYVVDGTRYYVVGNCLFNRQVICTDLKDIENTIVADAPIFDAVFCVDGTAEGVYFLKSGAGVKRSASNYTERDREKDELLSNIIMRNSANDSTYTPYSNKYDLGVWINNNQYANFLSFKKYDELQTKTMAQNLTITYGYEIGRQS